MPDPYHEAYLKAQNTRDAEAFHLLTRVVIASLPTGLHSFRGVEKLVRIHFGQGISFISVRKDLRCNNAKVREYQQAVKNSMATIREGLKK